VNPELKVRAYHLSPERRPVHMQAQNVILFLILTLDIGSAPYLQTNYQPTDFPFALSIAVRLRDVFADRRVPRLLVRARPAPHDLAGRAVVPRVHAPERDERNRAAGGADEPMCEALRHPVQHDWIPAAR
jgi:hypothetical protein